MKLVFIATILVVIGVFLPWAEGSISGPNSQSFFGNQSATGYEMNEGLISAAAAILGSILGFLGAGKVISRSVIGSLILITSIAIITITGNLIMNPGGGSLFDGSFHVYVSLLPGVSITLAGGVIMLLGGLALFSKSE